MKKYVQIVLPALVAALLACPSAQAQSLKDLLNRDNVEKLVGAVTGVNLAEMTGTWVYTGAAVEFESDNTVAAYTVLRTEPAAGEQLAAGSAVKVTVIRPLPDPNRPVPNVQGMALDAARDALQQAGLTAVVAGGATEGTVTAQDPIPGNLVKVFSPVTIYCR